MVVVSFLFLRVYTSVCTALRDTVKYKLAHDILDFCLVIWRRQRLLCYMMAHTISDK